MRNIIYICFIGLIALSCDDGDIFEVSLEFNQELSFCEDSNPNPTTFLLYETKGDPNESLSLLFPSSTTNDLLLYPPVYNSIDPAAYVDTIVINNTNVRFNYRTYSGDPNDLICQSIASPGTQIIDDYPAAAGAQAAFITTFEDDDNDGILSIHEGRGMQDVDNGLYPFAQDTDGDGIADYIDADDDNDGILTRDENPDDDEDGDPFDAINTNSTQEIEDGELAKPDYLDNDDDGDGIFTANENEDSDAFLIDDIDLTLDNNNTIPRYLDSLATDTYVRFPLVDSKYTRTTTVNVTILNPNIGILSTDVIELGTYIFTTDFMIVLVED